MTKTNPKRPGKPAATLPDPSPAEITAIDDAKARLANRPARVSLTLKQNADSGLQISHPHTDGPGWSTQISDTFGTASDSFFNASFTRLANAVSAAGEYVSQGQANAALALMGAIAPANELEAVIGEQIIACHTASLDFLRRARLNAGEYRDTAVAYTNAATKLSRTMGSMIETLAKLRAGGRQRIEVVYVNGPAVIGDHAQTIISGGGVDGSAIGSQPHAPDAIARLAAATGPPMRRPDAGGDALPVAGREGP